MAQPVPSQLDWRRDHRMRGREREDDAQVGRRKTETFDPTLVSLCVLDRSSSLSLSSRLSLACVNHPSSSSLLYSPVLVSVAWIALSHAHPYSDFHEARERVCE